MFYRPVRIGPQTYEFKITLDCGHQLEIEENVNPKSKMLEKILLDSYYEKIKPTGKIFPIVEVYCPHCKCKRNFGFKDWTVTWNNNLQLC
jgi:hypothetical protein